MLTGADSVWRILDHGTVQQLAGILGQGQVSPCDINPDGKSLLHFAVEFERPDMCKYLLEQGVNKNFEDHAGVSASAMAIEKVTPTSAAASRVSTLSEIRRLFEDDELLDKLNFPPLQLAIFRTLELPSSNILRSTFLRSTPLIRLAAPHLRGLLLSISRPYPSSY
ncbi:hypothetical protein N0V85_002377 [Neurospora sp. IMI 360204]|nr:hypothetical protein N0V85_002377 [Neurospora sp. IMI 360204]